MIIHGSEKIKILNSLIGEILTETETISILNTINYFDKLKEKLIEVKGRNSILLVDKELEIQGSIIKRQLNILRKKLKDLFIIILDNELKN